MPVVWAPYANRVDIQTHEQRQSMRRDSEGWWRGPKTLLPGTDYGFCVDDEGPFPDPRSAWQPEGVHGYSRVVEHANFVWYDANWQGRPLDEAVIYEAHIGTFTPQGTFDAAIEKLDYLRELGVTHLELMPVAAFAGKHGWGYDGVALYAPHEPYGGPDGLKRLVDACHGAGIGVLLDVVYNHLGPDGNYLARYAPYFTEQYRTPWGDAMNFGGPDSDEVRRYVIENAVMWIRDYHIDGLRVDAVHAIIDTSAVHILEQLGDTLNQMKTANEQRPVIFVESDRNDPRPVWPRARGGYGLDGMWNEDFHHALHTALTGEHQGYYRDFDGIAHLATALHQGFVYDGRYSVFRRRRHGRPVETPPGSFVGFMQNHDQVGNRAAGERIGHLSGTAKQKIGAALTLLSPFVPMIFQGEEWGAATPFPYFTDFPGYELAQAVREGRRKEFADFNWAAGDIPDPQALTTFQSAVLRWEEIHKPHHADMLDWYERLLALRKDMLTSGALREWPRVRADSGANWLVADYGKFLVACNLASAANYIPFPNHREYLLREAMGKTYLRDKILQLMPESVAIFEIADGSTE